jgi:hypothetical protein
VKKVAATIFLLVYFVTSSGATIQLHYCMDKLVAWSLASKEKSKCSKCGMEKKGHKGCCHDESRLIKLDKDHKATFNYFELSKLQPQIEKNVNGNVEFLYILNPRVTYPITNAPPLQTHVPVYLLNSVFRI